ncbi:hypothetical protein A2673_02910 [Candidatus Kaiserbacteria bacterium RIFCSPHIGHO2_01_FULL_50_13]|uniref:PrgI family protein n=1 Tax=Candidatus Kaiserbacteria bacterium RIFCSPLOWO2_01_FULL_50_24 TaxID=1798507 RepID=A0A1F6ERD1_9BACT|nr:MAG: hypothetical protein A2673_02910 [Candidatus Kaiserbacteria bacterium RIFCSPHIGHO2_01_FULL_50_13]OGG76174.1 MAG: hypothetical protein A3A34_01645 [Candidatus Kaiserbacteria bacterium RIFCSPLOWO2_01_FULL_50_24]OGG81149.1 MAG: hypothetical protein A3H74_01695 [Candidatus Kaiserbacteria bacterium RIFCSPLOWO2_02_FULL_51_13]
MQFQVPQFIEVEDKIFGPLTFKQFIYVIGGAGCCYLFWRILPLYIAAPFILAVGTLAVALAFLQFNGRPFIVALEHGLFYFLRSKLYLWNKEHKRAEIQKKEIGAAKPPSYIPHLSGSKLHDLAWALDIQERIQSGTASSEDRETYAMRDARDNVVAPVRTAREARI